MLQRVALEDAQSQPLNGVLELIDLVILSINVLVAIAIGTGCGMGFRGSYSDIQPQPQRFFTLPANAFHDQPVYQVHHDILFFF